MGAPVATAAALVNARTGRRVVIGAAAALGLLIAFLFTPLIAIPFAVAGSQASAVVEPVPEAVQVSGDWAVPLQGSYTKGRGFGYNPVVGCTFCSTDHQGYDMAQGCGATIYAAGPGTVITAGQYQGYGNTVRIDHGGGIVTLYGHMQWNSLRVTAGETVTGGDPIGSEGNTGRSFGCHLHFELRADGVPIDPEPFMAARGIPLV